MNKLREISGTRLAEAAGALEGLNGLMVEASLYTKRGGGQNKKEGKRTHTHKRGNTQKRSHGGVEFSVAFSHRPILSHMPHSMLPHP